MHGSIIFKYKGHLTHICLLFVLLFCMKLTKKMRGNTIMDTKIILQAVYYLSTKLGTIDKLHAIKYFYFADKYHLMKYSRMITNDTYYAMKMGPVASNVKTF